MTRMTFLLLFEKERLLKVEDGVAFLKRKMRIRSPRVFEIEKLNGRLVLDCV